MSIINATTADFTAAADSGGGTVTRTEQALGGEITARFLGFLRPPHTWEHVKEQLRICASYSSAILKLAPLDNHLVSNYIHWYIEVRNAVLSLKIYIMWHQLLSQMGLY